MVRATAAFILVLAVGSLVLAQDDVVFPSKNLGDVTFRHETHAADGKFQCDDCHPTIFSDSGERGKQTMAQMRAKKGCGVCHNGKNAFDVRDNCQVCHRKN